MIASLALTVLLASPDDTINRFVGDEIVVVVRVDLTRINVQDMGKRLLGDAVGTDMAAGLQRAERWADALKLAKADELYLLVDPADFQATPIAVVPLRADANVREIGRLLCDPEARGPLVWPGHVVTDGAVAAGAPTALQRIARPADSPRPDVAAAFKAAGEAPLTVVFSPSSVARRTLEEMVPTLPAELGGGPMTIFTRGMKWASITCETRPKALAKVLVEVQDPRGAEDVQGVWRNLLKWLSEGQGEFAQVAAELKKAEPRIIGDRLRIEMGAEGPGKLVGLGLRQTLETSGRVDCVNKLKQIALAMHNYHDVHKSFPPAFSADKDGKPLLSWRVLILPYIEQEALFKEFHLNEPWDSLHNKTLIPKMPKNYACPTSPKTNGLTTYLVPRGAGTIFPGAKGVPIKEITDGTSNTIMVMEVDDGQAKVWTKPEDWEVDPEPKLPTHHSDGTNISFADGSVRFLKGSISPKLLLKLLTKAGGEVISPDDL